MIKEQKKKEYSKKRNERVKAETQKLKQEAKLAKAAGIKSLESNRVVYRVKGDNINYSSYIKAELSTMDIVEINRTVATN